MRFKLTILILLICFMAKAQDVPLTVICNGKGAPSELRLSALRSILKGERQRWSDGTKVVIALMKTNTPTGSSTSKKIYNMSSDELNKFWLALVFQGKSDAPSFFNSVSDLENFVAHTPGAIGITNGSTANKTIIVDGKTSL